VNLLGGEVTTPDLLLSNASSFRRLRDALRDADLDLLVAEREPTLLTQTLAPLRRRHRFPAVLIVVVSLAFLVVIGWSVREFLAATDAIAAVGWATLVLVSSQVIVLLKIWYWIQMERCMMLRELQRLELQVARATDRRLAP
jgi:hypothetical protein